MCKLAKVKQNLGPNFSENIGCVRRIKVSFATFLPSQVGKHMQTSEIMKYQCCFT